MHMFTPVDVDAQMTREAMDLKTRTEHLNSLMTDMNSLIHMQDVSLEEVDLAAYTVQDTTHHAADVIVKTSSLREKTSALLLGVVGMVTLGPLGALVAGKIGALGGVGIGGLMGLYKYRRNRKRKHT